MQDKVCLPERVSKLMLSVLLVAGGAGFLVIGVTVLPLLGFLFALPLLTLGGYFFRVHLNERCRIEDGR